MRWALQDGTSRVAMLLGAVLAALLPAAFATGTMSATVTSTVLALALAALARMCTHGVGLAARVATVAPRTSDAAAALVLPGRATDTLHHPLRPRAPGLA